MNYNFGKLEDKTLAYAPDTLKDAQGRLVIGPHAEHYLEAGYLPVIDNPPAVPAGKNMHWEPSGWQQKDGTICQTYEAAEDQLPTTAELDAAVEDMLRNVRTERGYAAREPDAFLNSSVDAWKKDADAWIAYRDSVLTSLKTAISKAKAGKAPMPYAADFIESLPSIKWPEGK